MTKKEKSFLDFVKSECKKHKVKLILRKSKYLKIPGSEGGIDYCSGYFDSENMELVCAINHEDWLGILVHEYCHLTQFVENNTYWKKADELNSNGYVHQWLTGESVRGIKKYLSISRDLELDNEKRSVAMIKRFNLDIDVDLYVKRANAYINFYNAMYYTRKWCTPQNSPYKVKEVYEHMSSKFNMNYKRMSNKTHKIFGKVYGF